MRKTSLNAYLWLVLLGLVILTISGCKASPTPTPIVVITPPPTATSPPLRSETSLGEQKTIVLLARFPDIEPQITPDKARERIFTHLDTYIRQVSYEQTWLEGEVKGWYTLDKEVPSYSISPRNNEVDRDKVTLLVQEVINKADGDVDFSDYPNVLIILGAPKDAYGMMGYCAYPGMLGWADTSPFAPEESGEVIGNGVAVYCENAHVGVLAHDLIHILGGVVGGRRVAPCLYDHTLQGTEGDFRDYYQFYLIYMGFWDSMSSHFYRLKLPPPGLSSWTKLRLDWIPSSKVRVVNPGETTTVLLGPLANGTSDTLVVKIPLSPTTYYLVENRQGIGFDENLPGSGVLILYADDTVDECVYFKDNPDDPRAPVKMIDADPNIPQLEGAAFDTGEGKRDTFTDEEHNVAIQLLEKVDHSYEILITTAQE